MATSTQTQSNPFLKKLASSSRQEREAALSSLRTYLSSRQHFDELDLLKLWKGLYYCMYMQDKIRNQQRLAMDLADLVEVLKPTAVLPFLDAFWRTMGREWLGIDALRMDKYLLLVRLYLRASFKWLARNDWDTDLVEKYMEVLVATPLNVRDHKVPNGLRYHLLDIYVGELDVADQEREGKLPLDQLLRPLRDLAKDSPTKTVRQRAKEALDDEMLKDWSNKNQGKEKEEPTNGKKEQAEGWGGIEE